MSRKTIKTLFIAFTLLTFNSCKKDDNQLETTSGRNTLVVEIDGIKYQPQQGISPYTDYNGEIINQHNGVRFAFVDQYTRIHRKNFKLENFYSFSSHSLLNTSIPSEINFGLANIMRNGNIDETTALKEGVYTYESTERNSKPLLNISYTIREPQKNPLEYRLKVNSGTLTITRLTDKIISGKAEATLYNNSDESKKIVIHFDYDMYTINNNAFK